MSVGLIALSIYGQWASALPSFALSEEPSLPFSQLRLATTEQTSHAELIPSAELSPGATEAANLLGILPKVQRLQKISRVRDINQPMSDEELGLKVDILDRIMGGSLEVRMVAGRIDRELAWAYSSQGMLEAKRQKILNYLFTANFMQGGILGVLSGPAFLHNDPRAGTELLLVASSIGLGLSTAALIEARRGSKKMDTETTVLANVFGLKAPETLHKPEIVTKFMNAVPPDTKGDKSRIKLLMEQWQKEHYLHSTEEQNLRRLAAFQPQGQDYKENIKLISTRIRMLFDTQWTVEQLDEELLELLRATDLN
jgi:hypothetical protein